MLGKGRRLEGVPFKVTNVVSLPQFGICGGMKSNLYFSFSYSSFV